VAELFFGFFFFWKEGKGRGFFFLSDDGKEAVKFFFSLSVSLSRPRSPRSRVAAQANKYDVPVRRGCSRLGASWGPGGACGASPSRASFLGRDLIKNSRRFGLQLWLYIFIFLDLERERQSGIRRHSARAKERKTTWTGVWLARERESFFVSLCSSSTLSIAEKN
jgi:hypothetical protein